MEDDERRDVIRRLFTVAATRLEAAVASAGAGQASRLTPAQATTLANELAATAQELVALGDGIVLLARGMESAQDVRN